MERKDGGISFKPAGASEADLEAFQAIVRNLRRNEGNGYHIHIEHNSSDHAGDLVDLVFVEIDPRP